jgi:hypothetical protein
MILAKQRPLLAREWNRWFTAPISSIVNIGEVRAQVENEKADADHSADSSRRTGRVTHQVSTSHQGGQPTPIGDEEDDEHPKGVVHGIPHRQAGIARQMMPTMDHAHKATVATKLWTEHIGGLIAKYEEDETEEEKRCLSQSS